MNKQFENLESSVQNQGSTIKIIQNVTRHYKKTIFRKQKYKTKKEKTNCIFTVHRSTDRQRFCHSTERNRYSLVIFYANRISLSLSFACTLIGSILNRISYTEDSTPRALWDRLDSAVVILRRLIRPIDTRYNKMDGFISEKGGNDKRGFDKHAGKK